MYFNEVHLGGFSVWRLVPEMGNVDVFPLPLIETYIKMKFHTDQMPDAAIRVNHAVQVLRHIHSVLWNAL